ncbi:MAG: haloacid dehalogenase-like hydrolase [SAR324 cluster bacterium]|nr:haloacid dehalogenase-like hydrolase [SAR324 cluster bacterium]
MSPKINLAIAYDFDGTLSPGNMQEYSLFSELGVDKKDFWKEVKNKYTSPKDMDEILAYMYLLMLKMKNKGGLSRELFRKHGKRLTFFPGVETWFGRINKFADNLGIKLQHYIISSGLKEMIEASKIADEFDYIWASSFMYNNEGKAIWPALAINYTTKTQYLFRINKGVLNSFDNESINKFTPLHKRAVPFTNMIYLGDGDTDVPSMKIVMSQGGKSIAVYDKKLSGKEKQCKDLQLQSRVNYYAAANYYENSELDILIKDILQHTSANYQIK